MRHPALLVCRFANRERTDIAMECHEWDGFQFSKGLCRGARTARAQPTGRRVCERVSGLERFLVSRRSGNGPCGELADGPLSRFLPCTRPSRNYADPESLPAEQE